MVGVFGHLTDGLMLAVSSTEVTRWLCAITGPNTAGVQRWQLLATPLHTDAVVVSFEAIAYTATVGRCDASDEWVRTPTAQSECIGIWCVEGDHSFSGNFGAEHRFVWVVGSGLPVLGHGFGARHVIDLRHWVWTKNRSLNCIAVLTVWTVLQCLQFELYCSAYSLNCIAVLTVWTVLQWVKLVVYYTT